MEVVLTDDRVYDVVRDAVVTLGLGLARMERRRHSLSEVFTSREVSRVG